MNLLLAGLLAFTPDYSAIRAIPHECAVAATYTMAAAGLYDYVNSVKWIWRGRREVEVPTKFLGSRNVIGIGLIMAAYDYGITRIKSPSLRCAMEVHQTYVHIDSTVWSNTPL